MFGSRGGALRCGIGGALLATLACAAAAEAPARITVPPALGRTSATIEPSGVVWAEALQRYLVVSDDSGPEEDHHAPWLLALSREGVFDGATVPIEGLRELNDGESICAGPAGTFFLTTSHSPNRKGKTSPGRRQLLHLRLAGRALQVQGSADLTTARSDDGQPLLGIAGLSTDERLDIEAITFHDGALLIGLKSPLSARGGAVILRLADPVRALAAGRIPRGAVTRFAEVALRSSRQGPPVAQGIADLTVLADGSLILLGNAPKGGPTDGGGALYRLPAGAAAPTLLERFDGLKPEGVTLAADGRSLLIVFDNDTQPPLWVRRPLPGVKR